MRNADSAKTKKNKCMNKFKDIAAKLIESDEFAEEAVRAAVERAALKELIEDERSMRRTESAWLPLIQMMMMQRNRIGYIVSTAKKNSRNHLDYRSLSIIK